MFEISSSFPAQSDAITATVATPELSGPDGIVTSIIQTVLSAVFGSCTINVSIKSLKLPL